MKKLTLTLIGAASALALSATAASAQDYGRYDHDRYNNGSYDNGRYDDGRYDSGYRGDWRGSNIDQRQAQLERRIDWGVRNGSLDRTEANYLRNEARRIAFVEWRYRMDGLNGWERADLDRRLDRLSYDIRKQTHDTQYGYGYGPRYDYRR
jgi:opacity protein-like surface antigen